MKPPRILIVDDSVIVRELLRGSLMQPPLCAEVDDSENGAEAFARLQTTSYDCVICDIAMPVMDGMQFLAAVRAKLSRTELPVLLLTGYEELSHKVAGFEAGASDFVSKPWEGAELIARVKTHIDLVRLNRSLLDRGRQLEQAKRQLEATLEELRRTSLLLAQVREQPLEQQIAVARGIQLAMVPKPGTLRVRGARLAGLLEPASQCGGDFWTFLESEEELLLLVGDVTGHGVGAALITSVVKSCVDTLVLERGRVGPDELLGRLHEVIHRTTGGELTMSAFVVGVDPAARRLRFGAAGHGRQYLVSGAPGEARVSSLKARGVLLGSGEHSAYELEERSYEPGDRLVLFTDGVVECLDPEGGEYRDARLRRAVAVAPTDDPSSLLQHVKQDLDVFRAGRPPDDDITMVVACLA